MSEPSDTPSRSRRRGIIVNTTMNGIAQFGSLFSTLVFFPLLVRAFGTAEYGVYTMATSVAALALMFDFGIGASTVRLVARHLSLEDARSFGRVVGSAIGLLALVGAAIAAAMVGVGVVAGSIFAVTGEQASLMRSLLLVGAVGQLFYWPASVAAHVLAGIERYDLVARTSLVATILNVAAIAFVLLTGSGPIVLMWLGVGVTVGTALLNVATLIAIHPRWRFVSLPSRLVATEIVSGGIPVFVAGIAQFFNREQADRLVVGIVIGPTGVAVYEVAAKLSMLVLQVTSLATSAVLPVASGLAARDDDEGLRRLFLIGGRYISIAVAPVIAALIVLARPFVGVWFGAEFAGAIVVAQLLVAAQLFVPLYQMGDPVLIGKGRFHLWIRRGLTLAFLNVGLSLILVRYFGIVGVALGTLASCLLELPLYAQVVLRETGIPVRVWLRTSAPVYLTLPVAALVAWATTFTPLAASLPGLALAGILSVGACWALAALTVLTAEERSHLRAALRRGTRARGEAA